MVIAHRFSTIRKADQILVIEEGKIAERGTHDELIVDQGRNCKLIRHNIIGFKLISIACMV
ncbi:ABC-type multidrug transport system fused ATPase/permease subunit [Formosa algae]|uniref:ABC-type multidrug transport system fused ATPase/permease subunit n=1 Tax=Formosa algae TaxID=225843 RepID=A0A9X1CD93_9FLAO|nr:hypothetical protein [Formosa algae]MBP1841085.1 ABC-type multidrug transport system fused ATPase/permease subunit [Formosa algae]MDQ0336495.1 ABC-type multidrug transport system fused ATPase/permease subunit [Formosa algae]OEI81453.1 hypothetical protein AST99_04245 [Formosa algae]